MGSESHIVSFRTKIKVKRKSCLNGYCKIFPGKGRPRVQSFCTEFFLVLVQDFFKKVGMLLGFSTVLPA